MKKVLVKHSFEIWEEWKDEYATKYHIEFYYNEGTACADGILTLIENYKEKNNMTCLCHIQSSEVLEIKENEQPPKL